MLAFRGAASTRSLEPRTSSPRGRHRADDADGRTVGRGGAQRAAYRGKAAAPHPGGKREPLVNSIFWCAQKKKSVFRFAPEENFENLLLAPVLRSKRAR